MSSRCNILGLIGASVTLAGSLFFGPAKADPIVSGPTLTVDVAADRHQISPDIYGMNDNPWDPALGQALRMPVSRWGGDATTCYNWQTDCTNAGFDWYFLAGGKDHPVPSAGADAFVDKVKSAGGKALLTIPVIDYINKATTYDCSFPVSIVGPQKKVCPYVHPIVDGQATDAGNGIRPDGSNIILTTDQIRRVYQPNSPDFQKGWIEHLVAKFGSASKGGVAIYQLDNEPSGWSNTQRDIHPQAPTYREIVDKSLPYAEMIKDTDPTASVLGPSDFGWAVYDSDAGKNNGLGNAEYYLQRFHDASENAGKRLLDYFDEHYYPVDQDDQSDAVRLESTRSLWDPAYVEKDWIGKYYGPIDLIPRMRSWVNKYYPGTKLAITEYDWGGLDTLNGALAEADVLGIFGREGLNLATLWGVPKATDPGAFAFRIYRNYDGGGSSYGSVWLDSASSNQDLVSIYASQRVSDKALTIVAINKTGQDLACPLHLNHAQHASTAQIYRYSGADLSRIVRENDQPVSDGGMLVTCPASSITLVVIPQSEHR